MVLLLYVAQFQNEKLLSSMPHYIRAVCDTSTTIFLHGLEYYKGTISVENQTIRISAGNHLGIRFDSNCNNQGCLFQPAIVNESSKHTLYFLNDSFAMERQTDTSLLFSATIISGMPRKDYDYVACGLVWLYSVYHTGTLPCYLHVYRC